MNDKPPGLPGAASHRVIVVDPESEGQRVDVFLAGILPQISRSYLRKLIDDHMVLVDGSSVRASRRVRAGERVAVHIPPPRETGLSAQDIPLVVLHEDADLVVVNKAAGLVVHPAPGNPDGTLVNALLHHCTDLSGLGGTLRPGIFHRLDRGTSGVMVATKNDRAHRNLARQFLDHRTEKTYVAFAAKRPDAPALPDSGAFQTLFGRHPVHRKRFSSKVDTGKQAHTRYEVQARYRGSDWEALKILVCPVTGRTHQIRVHLADAGHPILGDKLYGGRSARVFPEHILPDRPALHALRLTFSHPTTGKLVTFHAPLPDDLLDLEKLLESGR